MTGRSTITIPRRVVCDRPCGDGDNFPWPEEVSERQIQSVIAAGQNILDSRSAFPDVTLSNLYEPNTMPHALLKAYEALDKAVDLCYRPPQFVNETKRIEFLFDLYEKYTAYLFTKEKVKKGKKITSDNI